MLTWVCCVTTQVSASLYQWSNFAHEELNLNCIAATGLENRAVFLFPDCLFLSYVFASISWQFISLYTYIYRSYWGTAHATTAEVLWAVIVVIDDGVVCSESLVHIAASSELLLLLMQLCTRCYLPFSQQLYGCVAVRLLRLVSKVFLKLGLRNRLTSQLRDLQVRLRDIDAYSAVTAGRILPPFARTHALPSYSDKKRKHQQNYNYINLRY